LFPLQINAAEEDGFKRFPKRWFNSTRSTIVPPQSENWEEPMHSTSVLLSSITLAAAGGWLAATVFAGTATGREPRFPQLTMDQLNDAQKPLGEQIMKISSVGLGGPYNPLMRSPVLGQRLFDLFHYLRWETSVPIKLNEFAILIIGRQWRSQVEWYAHAPLAAKAGLSADIIAELKAGKRPANMAEDEAVVYDFVTELTTTHVVSDETYARAKKVFKDQQIVDLTAVAGNYVMVAMVLAMSEETVPPGKGEPPFKVGEK
jgi:4-carboxymuconolactone decarboxylase